MPDAPPPKAIAFPVHVRQTFDGVEVSLTGIGGLLGSPDDSGISITTSSDPVTLKGAKIIEPGGTSFPATVDTSVVIPPFSTQRLPLSWSERNGISRIVIDLGVADRSKTIEVEYVSVFRR